VSAVEERGMIFSPRQRALTHARRFNGIGGPSEASVYAGTDFIIAQRGQ
jgi:hypothetical protein